MIGYTSLRHRQPGQFEKVNFTEVANLGGKYSFYFMILFIEFNELKTTSGYLIFTTFIIHIKSLQY